MNCAKGGLRIKLQQQPFEVLVALLERPGEIVTHDELPQRIWPDDTCVDFDHGMRTAILKIRNALGDLAASPRFVETVPRQGYRFIPPGEDLLPGSESKEVNKRAFRFPGWVWALVSGMVLFIAAAMFWFPGTERPEPQGLLQAVPLTSHPDNEWMGSFSPDGSQVTYTRCDPGTWVLEGNCDLYVKHLGAEEPLRLTTYPCVDWRGAWSPDGRWIAFLRYPPAGMATYFLISPLGGTERKLVDTHPPGAHVPFFGNVISWSPDGKRIVVTRKDSPEEPLSLWFLSLEKGNQRRLTNPPPDILGDSNPAVSPNGRMIVFSRMEIFETRNLFLLELSDGFEPQGQPVRLTSRSSMYGCPVWTADGREIVFALEDSLRRMPVRIGHAGQAKRLPFARGEQPMHPAISRDGRRLAYSRASVSENIMRIELSAPGTATGTPVKFSSSTRHDLWPEYSPNGERIAFVTDRSGTQEVWTYRRDGSGFLRVASRTGSAMVLPTWSPEGERIAFASKVEEGWGTFLVDARGGIPRNLATIPPRAGWFGGLTICWSRDGKWIFVSSSRGSEMEIWKIPADGGQPVRITAGPGGFSAESHHEGELYYLKPFWQDHHSLWRLQLKDGTESKVLHSIFRGNYSVSKAGIYFIPGRDPEGNCCHVQFFEFATDRIRTVVDVEDTTFGMSVAPDEKSLLYTQRSDMVSDVMLVENFR